MAQNPNRQNTDPSTKAPYKGADGPPSDADSSQRKSHPVGPTSIQGVEARDLPDEKQGGGEGAAHHEKARKLPQQTGENDTGDVGLRALPASADAKDHGYRKGN